MPRILILDPSSADAQDVVAAAARCGHEVHAAVDTSSDHHSGSARDDRCLRLNFADGDDALSRVVDYVQSARVAGVLTTSEFLTPLATRACAALGLPGNDVSKADAPRNKISMLRCLHGGGVSAPKGWVFTREEDVHALLEEEQLHLPFVVKPAENAASKGVSVVTERGDLGSAIQRARNQGAPYGMTLDERLLVQEYVDGDEFSVESVTQDGRTAHICVTQKVTTSGIFRIEKGHLLPAPLDSDLTQGIYAQASRAIAAVGIRNGVSHTEVKVDPRGTCSVIEIAARIGAGRIGELVELAVGVNLAAASVDVALGSPPSPKPQRNGYATVRLMVAPKSGRLLEVRNLPAVGGDIHAVEVTRALGTEVTGPESNKARIGYLIVTGLDARELAERADALIADVEVVVE